MTVPDRAARPRADAASDAGVATVWAATALAALAGVLAVGLHLGSAIVARHRAEAAADLAALAAAGHATDGETAACNEGQRVAEAMGARVALCRLAGWEVLLEAQVPLPFALPGTSTATGRAHSGPAPPDDAAAARPSLVARAQFAPFSQTSHPECKVRVEQTGCEVHTVGAGHVRAQGPGRGRREGGGDG